MYIKAVKVFLLARSSVFEAMFRAESADERKIVLMTDERKVIPITDVEPEGFKQMIR